MTKKNFVALADALRPMVRGNTCVPIAQLLDELSRFCTAQNPNFDRERWTGYIYGTCGPNGGRVPKCVT